MLIRSSGPPRSTRCRHPPIWRSWTTGRRHAPWTRGMEETRNALAALKAQGIDLHASPRRWRPKESRRSNGRSTGSCGRSTGNGPARYERPRDRHRRKRHQRGDRQHADGKTRVGAAPHQDPGSLHARSRCRRGDLAGEALSLAWSGRMRHARPDPRWDRGDRGQPGQGLAWDQRRAAVPESHRTEGRRGQRR